MPTKSNRAKWLSIAIILIQLFDIFIHVASDQVEPIRIAANIVIIIWVVVMMFGRLDAWFRNGSLAAIGIYLLLNLIFLAQNGLTNPDQGDALRTVLFVLVGLTLGLAAGLAYLIKGELGNS